MHARRFRLKRTQGHKINELLMRRYGKGAFIVSWVAARGLSLGDSAKICQHY